MMIAAVVVFVLVLLLSITLDVIALSVTPGNLALFFDTFSIAVVLMGALAWAGVTAWSKPAGRGQAFALALSVLALWVGAVGGLTGMIYSLHHLDNPAKIGPGLAEGLISLFFALLVHIVAYAFHARHQMQRGSAAASLTQRDYTWAFFAYPLMVIAMVLMVLAGL